MSLASHLGKLEASNLIRLAQAEPELEYMFRHALVQEAAYETLVKSDRAHLHLAVGETLERDYPDRLDDMAAVLAHHYSEAGERHKAVEYSRRAARRAQAAYAFEEAAQHLQTALGLLGPDKRSELRLAILEQMADLRRLLGDGPWAILLYQDALDLWRGSPAGVKATAVRLHRKVLQTVADIKWSVDWERFEAATRIGQASRVDLEAGLRLAESEPPHLETVRLLTTLSYDAWRTRTPPDWDAAHRYARTAVELAEQLGDPATLSVALAALGNVLFGRGELRQSLDAALRRLRLVSEAPFDDKLEQTDAIREAGSALMYVGEYARAIPLLEEAEAIAQRIQAFDQQFGALNLQSQCWFRLDRGEKVLEVDARWRVLEERYPRERLGPVCFAVAISGSVYAQRGELDRAEALRKEAYGIMAAVSGPVENWVRNQFY